MSGEPAGDGQGRSGPFAGYYGRQLMFGHFGPGSRNVYSGVRQASHAVSNWGRSEAASGQLSPVPSALQVAIADECRPWSYQLERRTKSDVNQCEYAPPFPSSYQYAIRGSPAPHRYPRTLSFCNKACSRYVASLHDLDELCTR